MNHKDFKNWLFPGEVDWKEVAWQHNTGKGYQHKQDLVACFFGAYIYIQQKFIIYYQEFGIIPNEVFKDLIFKFRQHFPKNGRIEGVNYFDDLIEMLLQKYEPLTNYSDDPYSKYFDSAPEGKATINKFQFEDKKGIWKYVDRILFEDYVKDETGKWIPHGDNKVQFVIDFLDYHFSKFNGDPREFFFFLKSLTVKAANSSSQYRNENVNNLYRPIIEEWIEKTKKKPQQKQFIETLKNACIGSKQFEVIEAWLRQSGFVDPVTFKWKDRKGRYRAFLVSHIKDLEIKGYTVELNDASIMHIAKNTFGVKIGISTIQHIKPESDIPSFLT